MARTRILTLAAIGAAAAALALTGCTTPGAEPADSKPSASAEPAIDPGPVALTGDEASARYLDIVCPVNIASRALDDAYLVGESEYLNGGAPDVAAVVAAAASVRDGQRLAIEQLDETYFEWPELVAAQLPHIRSVYMKNMSVSAAVASSATFEAAYRTAAATTTPEEDAAGQEIRYQLGIEADTNTTCVGHEDGLTVLSAEKAERDAELAKLD